MVRSGKTKQLQPALNITVMNGFIEAGVSVEKMMDAFDLSGIVRPTETTCRKIQDKILEKYKELARAEMKKNGIEHNQAILKKAKAAGDKEPPILDYNDLHGKKRKLVMSSILMLV